MAVKVERRHRQIPERSVYARPAGAPSKTVCAFWLKGRCTKPNCRFLHSDAPLPPMNPPHITKQKAFVWTKEGNTTEKGNACTATQKSNACTATQKSCGSTATQKSNVCAATQKSNVCVAAQKSNDITVVQKSNASTAAQKSNASTAAQKSNASTDTQKSNASTDTKKSNAIQTSPEQVIQTSPEQVCKFWVRGNCVKGDQCPYLHKWFCGDGFSMLAKLQGHKKAVTGIALPEGSDQLYSAGIDGTARIWDCRTGQCGRVINLGGEAGSLISEGPWVFVGVPNVVKAWNIQTNAEFCLNGPVGQVHAMVVANEMLFAGAQDGAIWVWKGCSETNPFHLAATLKGHTRPVVCLTVGRNRLYSGSVDNTIRVWDLVTLQCIRTLNGHSDAVMSLLCWDQFLFSCSLDHTIKVWVATEEDNLEVTYTHSEEHGVLALCGMTDTEDKPILFCSCNDNSVRLYELPSFTERGRLFARKEVQTIQVAPGGLFFSGDATGLLSVWKWLEPGLKAASS